AGRTRAARRRSRAAHRAPHGGREAPGGAAAFRTGRAGRPWSSRGEAARRSFPGRDAPRGGAVEFGAVEFGAGSLRREVRGEPKPGDGDPRAGVSSGVAARLVGSYGTAA